MVSKLNAPLKAGAAAPTVGSIYADIGFKGLWGGKIVLCGFVSPRTSADAEMGIYEQDSSLVFS